jgi:hypothetical protein
MKSGVNTSYIKKWTDELTQWNEYFVLVLAVDFHQALGKAVMDTFEVVPKGCGVFIKALD